MDAERTPLRDLALTFLRLGTVAFGGPAAHLAMMRQEFVAGRRWLTDQYFLDILGATNLIPGPNSTEVAIHIGLLRGGWRGLVIAGCCFILPAMLIVMGIAWAYVEYGTKPGATWLLYGVKPVIIAVVLQALYGLARSGAKSVFLAAVGCAVFALYLLGINEIVLLVGAALVVLSADSARRLRSAVRSFAPAVLLLLPVATAASAVVSPAGYSITTLFLTFLKIGSVLYGSGYVLLAFLRNDFVVRLGWLTNEQLLDAVAVGQLTPGPVFTTATFVGYLVGGIPGALVATVGIFLPSFLFVALLHPLVPRLRASAWTRPLLDGVNVAAIGLMAAVTVRLARDALVDVPTVVLAVVAAYLLIRFRVNSAWLVLIGGILGVLYHFA